MARRWFPHGKWPRFFINLHYYTIVSFILLMITGLALFLPAVHTVLIPYLPLIYQVHIVLGLVFTLTLVIPFWRMLPAGKSIRRLDWFIPSLLGAAIVITGVLLWRVTWFPTTWRSVSFAWHGDLSYLLSVWVVAHAVYKAWGYRPSEYGANRRINPERRLFLRWLGIGALGAVVVTVLDPFRWLSRTFNPGGGSLIGGSGFAAYYTVVGKFPSASVTTYQLSVTGMVTTPKTYSWADVTQMPSRTVTEDFHCVTGWSVPHVQWKGVHLSTIIQQVNPSPTAKFIHFYSFDGAYSESLSLTEALDATVLLGYELNNAPLSAAQGFPLRLVVPKMYGYKSIKWLNKIEFSDQPLNGFWEVRGYPNEAFVGSSM
jgi:hypothetical protein